MNWKELGKKILQNVLIGAASAVGIKAVNNVIDGKDVMGRNLDPKKTRMKPFSQDIYLGTDDYTII